jgi:hypothetical protein
MKDSLPAPHHRLWAGLVSDWRSTLDGIGLRLESRLDQRAATHSLLSKPITRAFPEIFNTNVFQCFIPWKPSASLQEVKTLEVLHDGWVAFPIPWPSLLSISGMTNLKVRLPASLSHPRAHSLSDKPGLHSLELDLRSGKTELPLPTVQPTVLRKKKENLPLILPWWARVK